MARPKIRLHEAQILQLAIDNLSVISDRNETLLDELDYEDLMDRIRGAITDMTWIIDYADRLQDDLPPLPTNHKDTDYKAYIRTETMKMIDENLRSYLKSWSVNLDYDTCAFCGKAPATHETSEYDFVCETCCREYENEMYTSDNDEDTIA